MRRAALALGIAVAVAGCAGPTAAPPPTPSPITASPTASTTAPASPASTASAASLEDLPVMPEVSAQARAIYAAALASGRSPQVFAKVGNCMMASPNLLAPFAGKTYDLGSHADLQPVIDYYGAKPTRSINGQAVSSFSDPSVAAANGFTAAGPLDPLWADRAWCDSGETPLACELRLTNPALALIMFGTNDVFYVDQADFERYMRTIIEDTLKANVLPVLITFPPVPGKLAESEAYNQVVARLAAERGLPLVNLWRALQSSPGYGVDPQHYTRLSDPPNGCAGCLTEDNLRYGITQENLVFLSALDRLRKGLQP